MDKIQALISLLDDPSEEIFNTVEEELLKEEINIVPELEKAWEKTVDANYQRRLENLIHVLQFRDVKESLFEWIMSEEKELMTGAWIVSRYQYPDLKYETLNDKINQLRKEVWLELNDKLTALEKVRIINHVMFDVHGFSRNNSNFMAPQNSFISDVFDTKKGNPISLSIIYSTVAQRLGLPIRGVNLPKNFILCYLDDSIIFHPPYKVAEAPILFYINPINKGAVLGRKEIEFFIRQQKIESRPSYFLPCSNIHTIQRMLNNLLYSYETLENYTKSDEVRELLSLFPS